MSNPFIGKISGKFSGVISVLVLLLYLSLTNNAFASKNNEYEGVLVVNPGSELWRDIRQRELPIEGISQIRGVDTGILINTQGDQWARFRVNELVFYAPVALLAIAVLLLLYYMVPMDGIQ